MGGEEGEVGEIEDGEAGRALEQLLDLPVALCERQLRGFHTLRKFRPRLSVEPPNKGHLSKKHITF